MKKNLIYMSCLSVLALCGACTEQTDDIPASQPVPISIQARTTGISNEEWNPFPEGAKITVYNAASDLGKVPATEKGIYIYKKQADDSLKWINNPNESYIGLWADNIQYNKDNNKHYFTATSGDEDGEVSLDQSKGYADDDFLVARSTVGEKQNASYWQTNGINLHFRHVLSKIRINVYLPIATNIDGYFSSADAITGVSISLVKPRNQYIVTYNTSLNEKQIATVTTTEKSANGNLTMCATGKQADDKVSGNTNIDAARYTFEAIIPHGQFYSQGTECLNITVKYNNTNYKFTYAPPGNTIMEFAQEKITIVNLTLLHSKPINKVFLNSVKLQNWITDETDLDLIPDNTSKP